jgi:hypothetical protein
MDLAGFFFYNSRPSVSCWPQSRNLDATDSLFHTQLYFNFSGAIIMAGERKRTRRNTLERRCLGKYFKRLFIGSNKSTFKMLEAIKKN